MSPSRLASKNKRKPKETCDTLQDPISATFLCNILQLFASPLELVVEVGSVQPPIWSFQQVVGAWAAHRAIVLYRSCPGDVVPLATARVVYPKGFDGASNVFNCQRLRWDAFYEFYVSFYVFYNLLSFCWCKTHQNPGTVLSDSHAPFQVAPVLAWRDDVNIYMPMRAWTGCPLARWPDWRRRRVWLEKLAYEFGLVLPTFHIFPPHVTLAFTVSWSPRGLSTSWGQFFSSCRKRMEKDGKGRKRMEKDGKGWKRMEKDGKGTKKYLRRITPRGNSSSSPW